MIRFVQAARLGTTLALFAAVGCSAPTDVRQVKAPPVQPAANPSARPAETPSSTTPTLAQFNVSVGGAQQQIDATLASLAALTDPAQSDVRGAYDKYCDNLARMQQHAASMRKEAESMHTLRDAYFNNWENENPEADNPTIRATTEARRKRLRDAHQQILSASNDAKDAYVPFMWGLEDIKKYLAPDLSKASSTDMQTAAKKAQAGGAAVKEKLGVLAHTLESVQSGV